MTKPMHYTVSQVAALTHLTVRALHHYDEIGLLKPSQRSAAGYRLYGDDDLRRLQQVLLFRELGFGLGAVRDLLDAPDQRRREALLAQRAVLAQQRRHADAVLRAVDATLQSLERGKPMNTEKLFEGCDQFQNAEYAREAEQRWGKTETWQESQRRTRRHSREDWQRMQAASEAVIADMLAALQAGHAPDSAEAVALAERHRLHIDHWHYPCGHAMQLKLAELYESDRRLRDYYEDRGEGLASYVIAAIRANASQAME